MIFNSKLVVAASMAMTTLLATAQPVHVHNMHKRQDVVVEAVTVTVTVGADAAAATPAAAPAEDVAAAVDVAAAAPAVSSAAAAVSSAAPAATTTSVAVVASSTSAAAPSSSSSSSGSFTGGSKGIVYSPYKVGGCKTADEVKSDLAQLSGYEVIRIYGVDCDQVPNVLAATCS